LCILQEIKKPKLILLKLDGSGTSHVNKITVKVQTGKPLT